jgi:hypothetical protein
MKEAEAKAKQDADQADAKIKDYEQRTQEALKKKAETEAKLKAMQEEMNKKKAE